MNCLVHCIIIIVSFFTCNILLVQCRSSKSIGRESAKEALLDNKIFARQQQILDRFKASDDVALTCGQFISSRGFDYEVHYVTTEDGYILKNYRLWSRYAKQSMGLLKPILLLHGLFYSGSIWLMSSSDGDILPWTGPYPPNDTSNSIAFHLANKGYDVWIINNRGTSYSTNHTTYNPSTDPRFWDFSFYEMGMYDLPATTEYIKKVTHYDKIIVFGYSQGTAQTLIKLALDPSYSKNYDLVIMAAPVAFLGDTKGLVSGIPRDPKFFRPFNFIKNIPFPLGLAPFDAAVSIICSRKISQYPCSRLLGQTVGYDKVQLNVTRLPVYLSQVDTTSFKDLLHFLQTMYYDQVHMYDYGSFENLRRYGSKVPPRIPYENVPTDNLVLISGLNDYLSTPKNVDKLRNILKTKPLFDHVIAFPEWSHLDFHTALEGYRYFGSVVDDILNRYWLNWL